MKIKNAKIEERINISGNKYYSVLGDTDRFGIQEILFESPFIQEVEGFCDNNEMEYIQVYEMVEEERTNREIRKSFETVISEECSKEYEIVVFIMFVENRGYLLVSLYLKDNGKIIDVNYEDNEGFDMCRSCLASDVEKPEVNNFWFIPYVPTNEIRKKAKYEYQYFKKYFKNVRIISEVEYF